MIHLLIAAAASTSSKATTSSNPWGFPILIALVVGLFYFVMIRPQKKRQTEQRQMMSTIDTGDQVVTAGGIIGTVSEVFDDRYVLEISPGVHVSFLRQAIARKIVDEPPQEAGGFDEPGSADGEGETGDNP